MAGEVVNRADWWPAPDVLARGVIAAARMLGEDPAQAFVKPPKRCRLVLAQAIRERWSHLAWHEIGRLCGVAADIDAHLATLQKRSTGWWAKDAPAALEATRSAMAGGPIPAPRPARPPSARQLIRDALAAGPATTAELRDMVGEVVDDAVLTASLSSMAKAGTLTKRPSAHAARRVVWSLPGDMREAREGGVPSSPPEPVASKPRTPLVGGGERGRGEGARASDGADGADGRRSPSARNTPDTVHSPSSPTLLPSSNEKGADSAATALTSSAPDDRDRLLFERLELALEFGPANAAKLRVMLGDDIAQADIVRCLLNMKARHGTVVCPHGAEPAKAVWRLACAPAPLGDYRPAKVGGVVGRMAAADMPAGPEVTAPSCRVGTRMPVTAPACGPSKRAVTGCGRNPADAAGDADEGLRVRNLRARNVPWSDIARQVGRTEAYLRSVYDPQYRLRMQAEAAGAGGGARR